MDKEAAVQSLTDTMAKFTSYIGKRLPKDVKVKLAELRTMETNPLAKSVYDSMAGNQEAADKLNRPSCQDTGVIQYFIEAGANFPLLGELEEVLKEATAGATRMGPLRHNAVETFDEKNTGTNTGTQIPWLDWRIVPERDTCTPARRCWLAWACPPRSKRRHAFRSSQSCAPSIRKVRTHGPRSWRSFLNRDLTKSGSVRRG